MPNFWTVLLALGAALAIVAPAAQAQRKTVCTITVNSADEKQAFRRSLPADKYDFVELVERGRPDWLASACRQGIHCDALIISGHHDNEQGFFSDRVEAGEYLNEDEMERVACSDSCPGLFSQLKEVYLFGCNTLNADPVHGIPAELPRSLVRAGYARPDADRIARTMAAVHADSGRDRMRRIFKDVPVIYGFSSVAPLGPVAAGLLSRHFQANGAGEVASGRTSARLLSRFAPHSMVAVRGYAESDPNAAHRRDVCQFTDDRLTPAQRLGFIHALLDRDGPEAGFFLDRIEKVAGALTPLQREAPDVAQALSRIRGDDAARARFMALARDAEQPRTRARMTRLAATLGWLTADEERAELRALLGDRLAAHDATAADVELACSLNASGDLDQELPRLRVQAGGATTAADAAMLACLGSPEGHAMTLEALSSPREEDVAVAQVYFRHHPIADLDDLRAVATRIAAMHRSPGQVRALQALGQQRLSDPQSLDALMRLYPVAESPGVQTAIAGILLRADFEALDRPELAQTLRDYRLRSADGSDLIDVLIRRLEVR